MRKTEIIRNTNETKIKLLLDLDGKGIGNIDTGCGFLDHMLTLFAKHSGFDLQISCKGDTNVDFHHTTEDVGIALGQAIKSSLGDMRGINRYADTILPMDEALILSALDISGRGILVYNAEIPTSKVGDFDTELAEEFFFALARCAGVTLHIRMLDGKNSHHIIEGMFKSCARSFKNAVRIDAENANEIPSTKGIL